MIFKGAELYNFKSPIQRPPIQASLWGDLEAEWLLLPQNLAGGWIL